MEFFNLTKAAIDGNYGGQNSMFFASGTKLDTRLRARIHLVNKQFASYMRTKVAKRRLRAGDESSSESEQSESSAESEGSDGYAPNEQLHETKKQMKNWVKRVCSRGPISNYRTDNAIDLSQ